MGHMISETKLDNLVLIAKKMKIILNTKYNTQKVQRAVLHLENLVNSTTVNKIKTLNTKIERELGLSSDIAVLEEIDEVEKDIQMSSLAFFWKSQLDDENDDDDDVEYDDDVYNDGEDSRNETGNMKYSREKNRYCYPPF